jgi:hypothetical protein
MSEKDHKFGMAPVYVGLYPELANIAKDHGYALAVHGSVNRDFDLIAVPWIRYPSHPMSYINAICNNFDIRQPHSGSPSLKYHGRVVYTLCFGHFGVCYMDLSFIGVENFFSWYTPEIENKSQEGQA